MEVTRGDVQKLYNAKAEYSVSVARVLKNVMAGINLPKTEEKKMYHQRTINTQKTFTLEQIFLILEKSKDSPIHIQVLFNVLMGLRRNEIIGVKVRRCRLYESHFDDTKAAWQAFGGEKGGMCSEDLDQAGD